MNYWVSKLYQQAMNEFGVGEGGKIIYVPISTDGSGIPPQNHRPGLQSMVSGQEGLNE